MDEDDNGKFRLERVKALKYFNVSFFQFEIIINVLVCFSAPFEYQCYGLKAIKNVLIFQCGDRFLTSKSDVYRRQILTFNVAPRTDRADHFGDTVGWAIAYSFGPVNMPQWYNVDLTWGCELKARKLSN